MNYEYTVYFEPLAEGGFRVVFPAIPEIITFGPSLEEAREMARDALRCHLEGLMQDGEPLPKTRPARRLTSARVRKRTLPLESHTPEDTPVKETLAITV